MADRIAGGALARIRGQVVSLRDAERKVAEHVLAAPEELLSETVSDVAAGSGVSEATVVRFARSVGYRGFQELKIAVARDHLEPLQAIHEDVTPADDAAAVAEKVFGSDIQTLRDTLAVVSFASLELAADRLVEAERILVAGVGTSGPLVQGTYQRLFRLGLPVLVETDAHLQVMRAALLAQGDVAFIISHSGSTKDPIETARVAKSAGASVIVVTQGVRSPLSRSADVVLATSSRETRFRSEALASRIAQASLIDALYVCIGLRTPERALAANRKIEDAIVGKQI